jgi:hypothetical protein
MLKCKTTADLLPAVALRHVFVSECFVLLLIVFGAVVLIVVVVALVLVTVLNILLVLILLILLWLFPVIVHSTIPPCVNNVRNPAIFSADIRGLF